MEGGREEGGCMEGGREESGCLKGGDDYTVFPR